MAGAPILFAGGVMQRSEYSAQSVLAAATAGTPSPLTISASTFVGRLGAGGIVAATPAQVRTELGQALSHTAAVAPIGTDDSSAGYGVGSLWLNTATGVLYSCTDPSVGAAVWVSTATAKRVGDFAGEQAVLADATFRTWIAPAAGTILSAYARVATAHTGVGNLEHSHIDVQKNGVSILNGATPILLNAASLTNAVAGVLSAVPGVVDFVAGDIFTQIEDHDLDGGGGDTGAGLACVVEYNLN